MLLGIVNLKQLILTIHTHLSIFTTEMIIQTNFNQNNVQWLLAKLSSIQCLGFL